MSANNVSNVAASAVSAENCQRENNMKMTISVM
jgi:hypothetical protein